MKRRDFIARMASAVPVVMLTGSRAEAQLAGGIDELTRELGFALEIPFNKAVAVTGALLHIARDKLLNLEFVEVTKFLPGTERLIFQAANVVNGALPKSMDGLPAILEKLTLPADAGDVCRDFIVQYLRDKGGRKVVGLLQKAWRS